MNSFAPWHSLGIRNVFTKLKSGPNGLVEREAKRRAGEFGLNIPFKPTPPPPLWTVIAKQTVSPINVVLVLLGAGIIFGGGDHRVARVLLVAAALQTSIGVVLDERYRYLQTFIRSVVRSLSVVKRLKAPRSRPEPQLRPIEQIVPGDVILVSGGDSVPADGRIVQATDFCVDESGLTGESFPQEKHAHALEATTSLLDRKNMVYTSSIVTRGKAMVAVTATGASTVMGAIGIGEEAREAHVPGHFAGETRPVFFGLLVVALLATVISFVFAYQWHWNSTTVIGVLLAVVIAVTPQWFMAIRTLLGSEVARRLVRMGTVMKYPKTAELLGRATVVCLDKTATLTQGALMVESLVDGYGKHYTHKERSRAPAMLWKVVALANDASAVIGTDASRRTRWVGDTTDCAFAKSAHECGYEMATLERDHPRVRSFPFDRQYKWMGTVHREGKGSVLYVKGAPERILDLCTDRMRDDRRNEPLNPAQRAEIIEVINRAASQGMRVVAVAMKRYPKTAMVPTERDRVERLVWMGVFFLSDPIREDSRLCIDEMQSYGLQTIIVTGDHPENARMLTRALGWDATDPVNGASVDQMSEDQVVEAVFTHRVFARVEPRQKERIVEALQHKGHVVVMTGDGVNDAFALKQADVGIAVSHATDIARDAADIIIGSDNLFSIISVLRQGRWVTGLIRMMGLFTLFQGAVLVTTILAIPFLGFTVNLWQVVWITLVMSALPAVVLLWSDGSSRVMRYPPQRAWIYIGMLVLGIGCGIGMIVLLRIGFFAALSPIAQQSFLWTVITLGPLPFMMIPSSSSRWGRQLLWAVVLLVIGVGLQLLALYDPWLQELFTTQAFPAPMWGTVVGFGIVAALLRWIVSSTQRLYVH